MRKTNREAAEQKSAARAGAERQQSTMDQQRRAEHAVALTEAKQQERKRK